MMVIMIKVSGNRITQYQLANIGSNNLVISGTYSNHILNFIIEINELYVNCLLLTLRISKYHITWIAKVKFQYLFIVAATQPRMVPGGMAVAETCPTDSTSTCCPIIL